MTRRTDTVPAEPPDFLTVDELAAVMRVSRNRAYSLVRRGVATDGRARIPAERIDKQFRISRYVIEQRLGGPITWPIPGFHDTPGTRPQVENLATESDSKLETALAKSPRRKRSNPVDSEPDSPLHWESGRDPTTPASLRPARVQ